MALDSSRRVIAVLARPAVASARGALPAGMATESAGGTDASVDRAFAGALMRRRLQAVAQTGLRDGDAQRLQSFYPCS